MARVSRNASIPYRLYDTGLTLERRQALRGLWARRCRLRRDQTRGPARSGRVLSCRDSVIIQTDTSKILFVFIQYQEGIEWNYGICAISSRLARSSISDGRRLASTSLSRHYRGRSRIWRGRLAFPCSPDYRAAFD